MINNAYYKKKTQFRMQASGPMESMDALKSSNLFQNGFAIPQAQPLWKRGPNATTRLELERDSPGEVCC